MRRVDVVLRQFSDNSIYFIAVMINTAIDNCYTIVGRSRKEIIG